VATSPFNSTLNRYFQSTDGAYSPVTSTEAKDGQVTVSAHEKAIVLRHFGEADLARYVGNDIEITSKGLDARRQFKLFPSGKLVKPKLKYPKHNNSELRLYFNEQEFKVREGHFWGVFLRSGDIWIFQAKPGLIKSLIGGKLDLDSRGAILEDEEDDFQILTNTRPAQKVLSQLKSWGRDPKVAAQALQNAGHACELFPELPTFRSRATGNNFVEAHHLIPMKVQADFDVSLDIEMNICSLSPFAHRKIHLAKFDDIVSDLRQLASTRLKLLDYAQISEEELLSYYCI